MDLYGLAPEDFTAARDALAREDKALKALRKPTVSAWVVNTLVRRQPALLDDLEALGGDLLEAQQQGNGPELRALTERRRRLVSDVTQQALGLVDRALSPAAQLEVEATLEAVLADPPSAEAVRTGQLVRALAFAGFGGVDLEGAVAPLPRPQPAKPAARTPSAKKDTAKAEAAALAAAGALDDAVQRAEKATRALEQLEADLTKAKADEDRATADVSAARAALTAAEQAVKDARHLRTGHQKQREALLRRASGATKAVAAAQAAADTARHALDALRRD